MPYALGVNPVVPAKNVRDLVAIAKRKSGLLSHASSGVGGMSALAAELLESLSGAEIVHIPYKGTAPALIGVAIVGALKSADVLQRLNALGYEPLPGSPEQFAATLKGDIQLYADIVKRAGITGAL